MSLRDLVLAKGLIGLVVFQCLTIAHGFRIFNQEGPFYLWIGFFQIALTTASFAFVVGHFFHSGGKPSERWDLFLVYFCLLFVADIFFSFTSVSLVGHIGFLLAYVVFFFIRKGRWWEMVLALGCGVAALLITIALGKTTPNIVVDCFLGAVLLCNLISLWVQFGKAKRTDLFPLCIALTLVLISDGSIMARTFLTGVPLNHIIALVTWPTYVAANAVFALYYSSKKRAEAS